MGKPTVYIAVDPGAKGGIAIRDRSSVVTIPFANLQLPQEVVSPPRKAKAHDDVELPYEVEAHGDAERRANVAIEKSRSKSREFACTNYAANLVAGAIKSHFKRGHCKVVFVDPRDWQKFCNVVGSGNEKGRPYTDFAEVELGVNPAASEHEKAARCILHWAESTNAWGAGA